MEKKIIYLATLRGLNIKFSRSRYEIPGRTQGQGFVW